MTIQKDNIIGCDYRTERMNASELAGILLSTLKRDGIDPAQFNSDKRERVEKPPVEIYEYQNFFLLERKDGELVLLDGFRRLLWYNAPSVPITVRIYKQEDLTDQDILTLLVHLNHFKFYGGGAYHDRGFSLLLRTVFGLDVTLYKPAMDAYLRSDKTKSDYSGLYGDGDDNTTVKNRILNPHFVSDMRFLARLVSEDCMVNGFMGAVLHSERKKTDVPFDVDRFIELHKANDVLNGLLVKFGKTGTTNHQFSQEVVNQIIEMYRNIFTIMRGGTAKKSFAEITQDCKDLRDMLNKDKGYVKLTGNADVRKIENEIDKMIANKSKLVFKCVVFPLEYNTGDKLIPGLRDVEIVGMEKKRHGMVTTSIDEFVLGFTDNNKLFRINHNYGGFHSHGKKYTTIRSSTLGGGEYPVDVYVNIPKEIFTEMRKKEKIKDADRHYLGYSSEKINYIAPLMGKARFIKILSKLSNDGGNWVNKRLSEGGNEKALAAIKANPDMMLMCDENYNIIKSVSING